MRPECDAIQLTNGLTIILVVFWTSVLFFSGFNHTLYRLNYCAYNNHILKFTQRWGLDPSAAAASRRAEFLGMRRAAAEFFYGSAESQPNFSNVPASRIFFGANSARTYSVV